MNSPLVEQFKRGGVSRDVRLTAAARSFPLIPEDQIELLHLLATDKDREIRNRAEEGLDAMSEEDLLGALKQASVSESVLDFYACRVESAPLQKAIVQNNVTENTTILRMIPGLVEENLEFVVVNQTRLIRYPAIIDALEAHDLLNADQRRRLKELKHDFKLDKEAMAVVSETGSLLKPGIVRDLEDGPEEDEVPAPKSKEEAIARYGADEGETEEKHKKNLASRIYAMNVAQKMVEALKGNREARMMLIRDRNRLVYSAVLASPKLTESDVGQISSMRNISPEVLRHIGKNPPWIKRYNITHELVRNPKTPPEIAMRLIQRLKDPDLKRLVKDRDVSEQVRRLAQNKVR